MKRRSEEGTWDCGRVQNARLTLFLPAATLGAVGLGEGKLSVRPCRLGQIMWENDQCMVLGGYLDI